MTREERNSFTQIPCVVCEEMIKLVHNDVLGTWEGIVNKMDGGFYSDFDFDNFNVGICNKCMKEKLERGVIYYSHCGMDYIHDQKRHDIDIPSKWDDILKGRLRDEKINNIIDEKDD